MHDTLEDAEKVGNLSKSEAHDMIQASIHDPKALSQVNAGLELLTHDKSIPYADYLDQVFQHPIAAIVKVSDLIHNLSHNPSPGQIAKYKNALQQVPPPSFINKSHAAELIKILWRDRDE